MNNIIIIYHKNCADGFGAAWSAWKKFGDEADYLPLQHGDAPPDVKDKHVYILDFSFDRETIKKMIEVSKSFLLLDHHASALKELKGLSTSHVHLNMEKSGAMLAWEYFNPGKTPPLLIQYIQDRDLWQWNLPHSKEISASLELEQKTFKNFDKLTDNVFPDLIKKGISMLEYKDSLVKKVVDKAQTRVLTFGDQELLVGLVNSCLFQSEVGNVLSSGFYDLGMIYYFNHEKKQYIVSIRSSTDRVDCSVIAKSFGGGGHPRASGFNLDLHPESILAI